MHISEGILAGPVLAGGAVVAVGALAFSLKKTKWDDIIKTGALSAAFFVASLIHVPLGPGNVHLILNGLLGAMLGWAALPAIAVALILQAVMFQYGGLTVLGVNICLMALPAVLCGAVFRPLFNRPKVAPMAAFLCGALAVGLSGLIFALSLALSGDGFWLTAQAVLLAHLPIMGIEGLLTMLAVKFLMKEKRNLLGFE